jgi:dTDP-4-dehydrorhamnose 3,5-epimerase
MKFTETPLLGSWLIEPVLMEDERGFFARSFCKKELAEKNIHFDIVQTNLSYNKKKGTLRGMHYQAAPFGEEKIVSCIKGRIYDVIIDLRPGSSTYSRWYAAELSVDNRKSFYIPKDFAHGFITLTDDVLVQYYMGEYYHPESARGIRWNDNQFNIMWPLPVSIISEKDNSYPDYKQ